MTWAIEGKIREPPDPPRTALREPSWFWIIVGAVEERGLQHRCCQRVSSQGQGFCWGPKNKYSVEELVG